MPSTSRVKTLFNPLSRKATSSPFQEGPVTRDIVSLPHSALWGSSTLAPHSGQSPVSASQVPHTWLHMNISEATALLGLQTGHCSLYLETPRRVSTRIHRICSTHNRGWPVAVPCISESPYPPMRQLWATVRLSHLSLCVSFQEHG